MAYGSGLSTQFGIGDESVVGTAVTVDHFYEIDSETVEKTKTIVQGGGLRGVSTGSGRFQRASRRSFTTRTVAGGVVLEVPTKGFGLWAKHMLGSTATPVQISSTTAYKQIHVPGVLTGKSFTAQKGVAQTDGTVKPFTYNGCKITQWELACAAGDILRATQTVDAWDGVTSTALASNAVPAGVANFHFAQGTLKLGGTVSTTSGTTSISGGTTVASVTGATVTGTNAMKTDRFFFGSSGVKAEQIENDFSTVTGQLDGEFVNQATIYDLFAADTATALELDFVGADAGGGNLYTLGIIIPNIHFEGETPKVGGPDVNTLSAAFTGLDDGTNPVIQLTYISTDTAI